MRWIAFAMIALPASAQEWTPRATDAVLDRAEMEVRVVGATHEFFDGGQSFFSVTGTYTYTYSNGQVAYGAWEWPADNAPGVICTSFQNGGFPRCDMYVQSDRGLVLLTADGLRLPVRHNSADG